MASILSKLTLIISLVLIGLLSVCLPVIEPSNAQSVSTPSTPEFSVAYTNSSYYIPLTYNSSIDPYTGQKITTTQGGYYIQNQTINVTIKNQPFTSTTIDGNKTHLYYQIRWKGNFENWTDHYINGANWYSDQPNFYDNLQYGIQASNSIFTVVSWNPSIIGIPDGGTVDFEVKAQVGYTYLQYGNHAHIMPIGTTYQFITESDWSNTQTLILDYNVNSTSTSDPKQQISSTPTVPEFSAIVLLPLVALVSVVVLKKSRRQGLY